MVRVAVADGGKQRVRDLDAEKRDAIANLPRGEERAPRLARRIFRIFRVCGTAHRLATLETSLRAAQLQMSGTRFASEQAKWRQIEHAPEWSLSELRR